MRGEARGKPPVLTLVPVSLDLFASLFRTRSGFSGIYTKCVTSYDVFGTCTAEPGAEHLIRNWNAASGWVSYLGTGAFYTYSLQCNGSRISHCPIDFSLAFLLPCFLLGVVSCAVLYLV